MMGSTVEIGRLSCTKGFDKLSMNEAPSCIYPSRWYYDIHREGIQVWFIWAHFWRWGKTTID